MIELILSCHSNQMIWAIMYSPRKRLHIYTKKSFAVFPEQVLQESTEKAERRVLPPPPCYFLKRGTAGKLTATFMRKT